MTVIPVPIFWMPVKKYQTALSFYSAYYLCQALLRRNRNIHMYMIRQRCFLNNRDSSILQTLLMASPTSFLN